MRTRVLTPLDASVVAELWLAGAVESAAVDPAFHPRTSVAEYATSIEAEFKSGSIIGWGAFAAEGILLGYLTARIADPTPEFNQEKYLYLLDLDVRSSERRRGVATELVCLARRYASERGIGSLEVSWLSADPRASAFWRKQGFTLYLARARTETSRL